METIRIEIVCHSFEILALPFEWFRKTFRFQHEYEVMIMYRNYIGAKASQFIRHNHLNGYAGRSGRNAVVSGLFGDFSQSYFLSEL